MELLRTFEEIEQEQLFRDRMAGLEHLFSRRLRRLFSDADRAALTHLVERDGFEALEDAVLEQPPDALAALLAAR